MGGGGWGMGGGGPPAPTRARPPCVHVDSDWCDCLASVLCGLGAGAHINTAPQWRVQEQAAAFIAGIKKNPECWKLCVERFSISPYPEVKFWCLQTLHEVGAWHTLASLARARRAPGRARHIYCSSCATTPHPLASLAWGVGWPACGHSRLCNASHSCAQQG